MKVSIPMPQLFFSETLKEWFNNQSIYLLTGIAIVISVLSIIFVNAHGWTLAYGDAESHVNIAKKVVSGLTPGFAQLGGIWLPLPHILMIPFVFFDPLWRSGLAGAFISGLSFIITAVYLYKTVFTITKNKFSALIAYLVFISNPNILYMQATPMTELPLICFFTLSSFYFIKFLQSDDGAGFLIISSLFGFCATLTRYDGWFLAFFEGLVLLYLAIKHRSVRSKYTGYLVLFTTLASFGMFLWFLWGFLILGDPLYFMNSPYSAHAQQLAWKAKNELPAFKHLGLSILYYSSASLSNIGIIIFFISIIGCMLFIWNKHMKRRFEIITILLVPFSFNVVTLFLGQDVIFIPSLTPSWFEWHMFNVRYGLLMVTVAAFFYAYLFFKSPKLVKFLLSVFLILQIIFFVVHYDQVITFTDGTQGLSASKIPTDVENFIKRHYTGGLVLIDDYARTISIARSTIPMQNIIYVGTKPYWDDSFITPQKYARWIIMQKNDAVWVHIYENPLIKGRLYKYFNKVYTSNEILIFKRIKA